MYQERSLLKRDINLQNNKNTRDDDKGVNEQIKLFLMVLYIKIQRYAKISKIS